MALGQRCRASLRETETNGAILLKIFPTAQFSANHTSSFEVQRSLLLISEEAELFR